MSTSSDFHHRIAVEFDEKYRRKPAFRERYSVWRSLIELYAKPGEKAVDLGCGSGIFSECLAERGCLVAGVDGAAKMIELCRMKNLPGCRFMHAELPFYGVLPEELKAAHIVLASSLLEYVEDIGKMLENIREMLSPGGILIVSMPNQKSWYRRLEKWMFQIFRRPAYYRWVRHTDTVESFSRRLSEYGFHPVETRFYGGNRRWRAILPASLSCNLFVSVFRADGRTESL